MILLVGHGEHCFSLLIEVLSHTNTSDLLLEFIVLSSELIDHTILLVVLLLELFDDIQ